MKTNETAGLLTWTCALALAMGSLVGCKDPAAGDDDTGESGDIGDTGDTGDTGVAELTFWQDVAPIYYEQCVSCHREGSIGPFTLDDYGSAAAWAQASALAVDNRTMPPWLVVDDGSCGEWANSRALSQEQIDTILAWVDAGAPEGTPRDDLSVPALPGLEGGTAYTTPLFTPEPEGGVFSKYDEYRCFLFDPQLDGEKFITGYEVIPGNDALVHHALLMPVDPSYVPDGNGPSNLEIMQALDDESPDRLGWPCFGLAGDGVEVEGVPVTWAPGQGVVDFPDGSGVRVGADSLFVVQIHYNMADAEIIGQSDSTTVNLRLEDSAEREGFFDLPDGLLNTLFEGQPAALPVGQAAYDYVWEFPVDWYLGPGQQEIALWGYFPHMHQYGVQQRVRVLDANDNEVSCVGEVPRWDFEWQLYYFYQQPIMLQAGQRIEITCTYDTSEAEEAIWPGWGTYNEMCLAGLYLVI